MCWLASHVWDRRLGVGSVAVDSRDHNYRHPAHGRKLVTSPPFPPNAWWVPGAPSWHQRVALLSHAWCFRHQELVWGLFSLHLSTLLYFSSKFNCENAKNVEERTERTVPVGLSICAISNKRFLSCEFTSNSWDVGETWSHFLALAVECKEISLRRMCLCSALFLFLGGDLMSTQR